PRRCRNRDGRSFCRKRRRDARLSHVSSSGRAHWRQRRNRRGGSLSLFLRREIYHRKFPRGGWRNAGPIKNTCRNRNIMHRIVEANFLPPPVAEAKEKPRILIIDNNRDFTDSAKLGLERTGRYSVWEENEPARAHQTAQRVKPDLILLDIAMPETDGGEVAARIGQHAKKRSRAEIIARNNKERHLRS